MVLIGWTNMSKQREQVRSSMVQVSWHFWKRLGRFFCWGLLFPYLFYIMWRRIDRRPVIESVGPVGPLSLVEGFCLAVFLSVVVIMLLFADVIVYGTIFIRIINIILHSHWSFSYIYYMIFLKIRYKKQIYNLRRLS